MNTKEGYDLLQSNHLQSLKIDPTNISSTLTVGSGYDP